MDRGVVAQREAHIHFLLRSASPAEMGKCFFERNHGVFLDAGRTSSEPFRRTVRTSGLESHRSYERCQSHLRTSFPPVQIERSKYDRRQYRSRTPLWIGDLP